MGITIFIIIASAKQRKQQKTVMITGEAVVDSCERCRFRLKIRLHSARQKHLTTTPNRTEKQGPK